LLNILIITIIIHEYTSRGSNEAISNSIGQNYPVGQDSTINEANMLDNIFYAEGYINLEGPRF
jgi:hypothetical protein